MIPQDLYALPTLASCLALRNEMAAPLYQCPTCPRQTPPEGLVCTNGLPGNQPKWVCFTCASGPHREALAAQAAAELETTGPDWSEVRARRNNLLAWSDWTQMADAPLSEEARALWVEYRAKLRDVTSKWPSPDAVVWPSHPV